MSNNTENDDTVTAKPEDQTPHENGEAIPSKDALPAKKQNLFQKLWNKTGLDIGTMLTMAKGALPPVIALAAYQSDAWARKYSTLGYLVAIMSLLSMAIQPRAKFLQAVLVSILFVCIGAAVALLQIQCVVSARERTTSRTGPHGQTVGASGSSQSTQYNSSASAVAGVFLFFTIYVANALRAKRPQLQLPLIQYCIFTIVASTYAPQFPNMNAGMSFVKRLLETFLTGFGIATGVSLFIIPTTSRTIASKQMGGLLALMKASVGSHGKYMESVSTNHQDKLGNLAERNKNGDADLVSDHHKKVNKKKPKVSASELSAEARAMKELLSNIGGLFGKIDIELGFAKKELAYGNLTAEDFSEVFRLLREILLPIFGMTTFIDIMQSIQERKTTRRAMLDSNDIIEAIRRLELDEWEEIISMSHEAYEKLRSAMIGGLTHIGLVLEFEKRPKSPAKDVEQADAAPPPGDPGFAEHLEAEIKNFHFHREGVVRSWCEKKGVELPSTFWNDPAKVFCLKDLTNTGDKFRQKMNQQQLYLILYLEFLIASIGAATLKMVHYADSKVEDGTMKKKRMIIPPWHRIKKFAEHAFQKVDTDQGIYDGENSGTSIWIGDGFKHKKDPEHLPPTNFVQKSTNLLRAIPGFLGSPESSFGFRAAVATMSIGILAFVRQTYVFFLEERVLWAMIMIAISLGAHAGQGIFGFVTRIFGTAVAMVASIAIWYIGDQKTAAILPIFYIYLCGGIWFLIKNPTLIIVAIISMVSAVLILGYELQEKKIGLKLSTSNGQPYYPIYILSPYRLATVVAGLAVNFIWTYFPYPVTTHTTLRKDLGATLYVLANYYSVVHTTAQTRLRIGRIPGNPVDKHSPVHRLDKARHKVFSKLVILLNRLQEHSNFTRFEPTFGGKFPKATYDELIQSMRNMFNYMSLISYSTKTFTTETDAEESAWLKDFRKFASELNITSHDLTSTLCLVSASVSNSQPLPPYLKVPKPYSLADRMEAIDPELLSVQHVSDPCYAAFAVLEIASSMITQDMAHIVKKVQDLVGEVDFSFHVVSTNSDGSSTSSTLWDERELEKGKKE